MPTILVVDDEPDLRLIWRTFLERSGNEVIDVGSGRDALDLLNGEGDAPDAVLLDLRMDDLDGWQVLEALGPERLAALPVVVVSVQVDHAGVERARSMGCRGFLAKPFTRAALDQALRDALASGA